MLLAMLGERVAGLEILVRQSRDAAGGIDYRLRTVGLANREAAKGLCTEIVAAGHPDCLVIRHNPALWRPVAAIQPQPTAAAAAQYRIQLASYRTQTRAVRGREILSKLLGDQMKALEILVKRSHTGESKSIDFTVRSVPLESREEGARLCDAIRAAGHPGCLVIRHGDAFWQRAGDDPGKRAAAETR
jgi:cell division septation protein DedD